MATNQRQRLLEGMIDAIGAKGYAASTVSDVIKRAGVSRKAFYEHFANKEECFLAAYDSIAAIGQRAIAETFRRAEGLPDGVERRAGELFELAIERPAALRVLMVEIGAAGPAGIERREQLAAGYEDFLRESLGLPAGPGPIPNPVLRGVVGGLLHVLYGHLRRGRAHAAAQARPGAGAVGDLLLAGAGGDDEPGGPDAGGTAPGPVGRAGPGLALARRRRQPPAQLPRGENGHVAQLRGAQPARADPRRGHEPHRDGRATRP